MGMESGRSAERACFMLERYPLLGISQRGDRDEDFSGDRAGNFRLLLPQKTDFPRLELYATAQPFPAGDQFQEKTGSLS